MLRLGDPENEKCYAESDDVSRWALVARIAPRPSILALGFLSHSFVVAGLLLSSRLLSCSPSMWLSLFCFGFVPSCLSSVFLLPFLFLAAHPSSLHVCRVFPVLEATAPDADCCLCVLFTSLPLPPPHPCPFLHAPSVRSGVRHRHYEQMHRPREHHSG
jgi:hypothetical protein